MEQLSVTFPGAFQVAGDGEPITEFEADSARALLAYPGDARRNGFPADSPCRPPLMALTKTSVSAISLPAV